MLKYFKRINHMQKTCRSYESGSSDRRNDKQNIKFNFPFGLIISLFSGPLEKAHLHPGSAPEKVK